MHATIAQFRVVVLFNFTWETKMSRQQPQTQQTATNADGTKVKKQRVARASREITSQKQLVAATKNITKWQGFIDEQNEQIQAYLAKQPDAANVIKQEIERLQKLVAQFQPKNS